MINPDAAGLTLAAGAALLAGAVNAIGGGGTLVSFPALLFLGYPPLTANVTNTVGLLPGYAGGSLAYREELAGQSARVRYLGVVSGAGAVLGALLLTRTAPAAFSAVVPWLILVACALLLVQPALATVLASPRPEREQHRAPLLVLGQLFAGTYGAFFGAGFSVMMLGILGLFIRDDLQRLNALKGALSLIVTAIAALYFAVFGPVAWTVIAVMAPASLAGGVAGVALARRLNATVLRAIIVAFGLAVAVRLLV
ncbi:MAG TPA: sulfite exporter TauE/SafE family protein [Candidatus Acidoferrales bacterium]|nr:sulfite exporter TauE/SafE family protein [Candidatus Acidoferrales bacterium]